MAAQLNAPRSECDVDYPAPPGLLALARPIFLRWELLRIPYNAILVMATILIAGPVNLLQIDLLREVMLGAVVANVLYYAGPVAETYIRWLGLNQDWVRWPLFGGGTVLTIVIAAVELDAKLSPAFGLTAQASFSTKEISGTAVERINAVKTQLARHKAPPTALTDAHYLLEQFGDGALGPSDFHMYYAIKVTPADAPLWMQGLAPLANKPEYAAPKQPREWWITPEAFESLQFYEAKPYTGRENGWIGVDPASGRIFVFSFTM